MKHIVKKLRKRRRKWTVSAMPRPRKKVSYWKAFVDVLPLLIFMAISFMLLNYIHELNKIHDQQNKSFQSLLQENTSLKAEIEKLNKREPKVRVLRPKQKWYGIPQRWKDKGYSY